MNTRKQKNVALIGLIIFLLLEVIFLFIIILPSPNFSKQISEIAIKILDNEKITEVTEDLGGIICGFFAILIIILLIYKAKKYKTYICPECQKTIKIESKKELTICPYCGKSLRKATQVEKIREDVAQEIKHYRWKKKILLMAILIGLTLGIFWFKAWETELLIPSLCLIACFAFDLYKIHLKERGIKGLGEEYPYYGEPIKEATDKFIREQRKHIALAKKVLLGIFISIIILFILINFVFKPDSPPFSLYDFLGVLVIFILVYLIYNFYGKKYKRIKDKK